MESMENSVSDMMEMQESRSKVGSEVQLWTSHAAQLSIRPSEKQHRSNHHIAKDIVEPEPH